MTMVDTNLFLYLLLFFLPVFFFCKATLLPVLFFPHWGLGVETILHKIFQLVQGKNSLLIFGLSFSLSLSLPLSLNCIFWVCSRGLYICCKSVDVFFLFFIKTKKKVGYVVFLGISPRKVSYLMTASLLALRKKKSSALLLYFFHLGEGLGGGGGGFGWLFFYFCCCGVFCPSLLLTPMQALLAPPLLSSLPTQGKPFFFFLFKKKKKKRWTPVV